MINHETLRKTAIIEKYYRIYQNFWGVRILGSSSFRTLLLKILEIIPIENQDFFQKLPL